MRGLLLLRAALDALGVEESVANQHLLICS